MWLFVDDVRQFIMLSRILRWKIHLQTCWLCLIYWSFCPDAKKTTATMEMVRFPLIVDKTQLLSCSRESSGSHGMTCGGGGPGAVLGKPEIAGSNLTLAFKFQRNKMSLLRLLVKIQYCGEPSVLGLRVLILNSVSGVQCNLYHLTIVSSFSWHSLAYMCTKVAQNPINFISFYRYDVWSHKTVTLFAYQISIAIC